MWKKNTGCVDKKILRDFYGSRRQTCSFSEGRCNLTKVSAVMSRRGGKKKEKKKKNNVHVPPATSAHQAQRAIVFNRDCKRARLRLA